ncbi:hypothetical protein V8E53_004208, partial [Lactarius tabidus]
FVYPLPPILARVPILLAPPPHSRAPVRAGSRPQLWAPIATGAQGRAGKDPLAQDDAGTSPPPFVPTLAHSSSTRKRGAVPEGHANAGRRGTTRGQAPSRTRANPRANGGTCRRIYPLPPCAPTPINARGDVQGYQGRQGGGGTIDPPSPLAAAAASPSTFATCSARGGGARRPVRAPLRGTEGV